MGSNIADFSFRVGETKLNNFGSTITIVEYNRYSDIIVEFENGYRVKTNYNSFLTGMIESPFERKTFNVGYLGEPNIFSDKDNHIIYKKWQSMLSRCYSMKTQEKQITYKDCVVCEEWLNFSNFKRWYNDNFYQIENEKMCLDKDILVKGNKIYSPETCCFVSQRINNLFTKGNSLRGNLPLGVGISKRNKYKIYYAQCNNIMNTKSSTVHLGYYNTIENAFEAYKEFKEKLIKETAELHKNKIPDKLYQALLNYKVEITD